MFVEHTYTRSKPPDPGQNNGECLVLKMWIGVEENTERDSFECWSYDDRLPVNLLNRIQEGVYLALRNHKFPALKVVLIEYRWSDVHSPEWLFEVAAKACVQEALQELAA